MNHCLIATALDSSQFAADLLAPAVRQQAAEMGAHRRQQFLAGRSLLAMVMREYFGCDQLPDIQLSADGKPAFCDSSLPYFSLSHSRQHLLVAVCSSSEIGCDIEALRPRVSMLPLAREVFSVAENRWLLEQGEKQIAAFWQLWTLREAWLKQQGSSVWQMTSVNIDPLRQRFSASSASAQLMSLVTADCAIALALTQEIKQITAFSVDISGQLSPYPAQWQSFTPAD